MTPNRPSTSPIRRRRAAATVTAWALAAWATAASAQSLERRLDEEAFLRGLAELRLPEVLDRYADAGGDDTFERRIEIARRRMATLDADSTPEERRAAVDALLAAQAALVDSAPSDPRLAIWLTDLAEDRLLLGLPLGGDDLRARHGDLPGPRRAAVLESAARAATESRAAERAALDAITRLERDPAFEEDLGLRRLRDRLERDELGRRVPLIVAVATVLAEDGDWSEPPPDPAAVRTAVDRLTELIPRLDGARRHAARTALAIALIRLGRVDDARPVLAEVDLDATATPLDRFRAALVRVEADTVARGPDAGVRTLSSIEARRPDDGGLYESLVLAEQRLRLAESVSPDAAKRAYGRFEQLVREAEPADRDRARTAVLRTLADLVEASPPRLGAHPLTAAAAASAVQRDASFIPRSDVQEALGAALQGTLSDLQRVMVATAAARLGGAPPSAARIDHLLDAVDRAPTLPESEEAARLAAALAIDAAQRTPGDRPSAERRRRALDLLVSRRPPPPDLDRWTCELARAAIEDGDLTGAIAAAERVDDASPWAADAASLRAAALRSVAISTTPESPAAWRAVGAAAAEAARLASQPLPAIDDDTATMPDPDRRAALARRARVLGAEARLRAGDAAAALEQLDDLETSSTLGASTAAEMLRLRIAALRTLGRAEEAAAVVEAYMEAAPERAWSVLGALLLSVLETHDELVAALRDEEARRLAVTQIAPLGTALQRLLEDPRMSPQDPEALLSLRRAQGRAALATSAWPVALASADAVLAVHPDALEALSWRAEALFRLGGDERLAESMSISKRIAAARADALDEYFWSSELRTLAILDRVNRNVDQIRPRIDRLRALDPELGGERWRRELDALAARHR